MVETYTAGSPLKVMISAFVNSASDKSTEAVAAELVEVPVDVSPALEIALLVTVGWSLVFDKSELLVVSGAVVDTVDGCAETSPVDVLIALDWLTLSLVCSASDEL